MVIRLQHIAYLVIVLVVGTLGCAPRSSAEMTYQQQASKESEKLKQLNWALDAAQKNHAALQITQQELQEKLAELQKEHGPSQERYFKSKRRLQSLKHRAGSTPSLEQMSAIKNEELKFILIESKHEGISETFQAQQEALGETQNKVAETSLEITRLNRKINQQHKLIEKTNRLAFQQKDRLLLEKEQRMIEQANVDREEIARLKALLAEKEQALATAIAEANRVKAELARQQKPNHNPPQPGKKMSAPVAKVKIARSPSSNSLNMPETPKTAPARQPRLDVINDEQAARQAVKAFTAKASEANKTNKNQSDRLIKIRRDSVAVGGSSTILEARGNFQYRGKLRLKGGSYELKIGEFVEQAVLPANDRHSTYIVLFDNRPGHSPRLSLLEKKLLH